MKQSVTTTRTRPAETCPACGTPLQQPVGVGRKRVQCSETCRKRLDRQRVAARLELLKKVEAAFRAAQYRPKP